MIVCISEHWLNTDNITFSSLNVCSLADYFCRMQHIHEGVLCFVREGIDCKPMNVVHYCAEIAAEFSAIQIDIICAIVLAVYRPEAGNFDFFLNKLDSLFTFVVRYREQSIYLGISTASCDILSFEGMTCCCYWPLKG